ncbi:unnamed protein product [Pedinophyceae sp. YPF-701]|nr:unnamed protein product [Pedinophyceae sp. YPF-701]
MHGPLMPIPPPRNLQQPSSGSRRPSRRSARHEAFGSAAALATPAIAAIDPASNPITAVADRILRTLGLTGARELADPEGAVLGVAPPGSLRGGYSQAPVTKSEIGRATWTFLHSVAADFPERPSARDKRDARCLMDLLTRRYPCEECRKHFAEIIRSNPPRVESGKDFRMWMCHVHNIVNRSIGKPAFNCDMVAHRWGEVDCEGSLCNVGQAGGGR